MAETVLKWFGKTKKIEMEKSMIEGLVKASTLVQSTSKSLAPVDTGNLKGSITRTVRPNKLEAEVGTNVEYAPYVEFGLRNNPNYPKQPYLRPALNNNKRKIQDIFSKEGEKAIDK